MTSTDHYEDSSYSYYSYSKQNSFKCIEKFFRYTQSALLLYMIFCFIFYMITVGIDIAKLSNNLVYLLISIAIDTLAMSFIVLGVRGVALEIWPYVLVFIVVIVLVTVGHSATFLFRHPGLNSANFFFDLTLSVFVIVYAVLLYRFEKLKPADYDVRQRMTDGHEDEYTDVEITGNRTSAAETGTECLFKSPTESKLTEITGMELSDVVIDTAGASDETKH